jgi:Sporulation and spore germination/Immunoglobulin-like domain of bacterial spore germination
MNEELLRQAMQARAEAVEISPDALPAIRRAIDRRRTRRFPLIPVRLRGGAMFTLSTATLAASAAVVVAVAVGTAQCTPENSTPPPATSGSPAPSAGHSTPAAHTSNLAVYYLGANNRLYREFHQLPAGDSGAAAQVRAAVTEMLDGRTAHDPDYHSGWPASAAVRDVQVSGTSITVDLSGASINGDDPPTETAALQQLIWTATAVVPNSTMRLLLDGQPVAKLWNLLPASGDLHRGSWLDVQALIQVIDPQQDATVGRTFTATVDGSAFEATAVVRIRDAGGAVIKEQSIQVGSLAVPNRATAKVTFTLAPGRYTIEGFVYSARDSSVQQLDDHQFTVK